MRELDEEMLVISDANQAIAIAGVMGGANSEISPDTTAIILESANFNSVSIRKTAKSSVCALKPRFVLKNRWIRICALSRCRARLI